MTCAKCGKIFPDGASYCCWCGRLVGSVPKRKQKQPNGTGYAYKRGSSWSIRVTIGFRVDGTGHRTQVYRTKCGFKTKQAALVYAESLKNSPISSPSVTMEEVYRSWEEGYRSRVSASTMQGYSAAYNHYSNISLRSIASIRPLDLQACIDGCKAGKRTKQMMKVIAGLIWKYAQDNEIVQRNAAQNLYTGNDETETHAPITDLELQKIKQSSDPYAPYVVALCYLGFRPGEMLKLRKCDVNIKGMYIVGGSKTDAGRDRIVTIPPAI